MSTLLPASTPSAVVASHPLRITGATVIAVLASTSLMLSIFLQFILIKNHRYYKRSAFFIITWQLVVCDTLTQVMQILLAVPIIFTDYPVYGQGPLIYALASLDTCAYYGAVFFSFLMAVNRATVFFAKRWNHWLFEVPRIYGTVALTWLIVLSVQASTNLGGCYKEFDVNAAYAYNNCPADSWGKWWRAFWSQVKKVIPLIMFAIYIAIFVYIRFNARIICKKDDSRNSKGTVGGKADQRRDRAVLLQSFIICGVLELRDVIFDNVLPNIFHGPESVFTMNFVHEWIHILSNTMTPIIMFTWNSEIRGRCREIFHDARIRTIGRVSQLPSDRRQTILVSNTYTIATVSHQ